MKFYCHKCGERLEVDSILAGIFVECPSCHIDIEVPSPYELLSKVDQVTSKMPDSQNIGLSPKNSTQQTSLKVKNAQLDANIAKEERNLARIEDDLKNKKTRMNGARLLFGVFIVMWWLGYTLNGTFMGYSSMVGMPFDYYLIPYIPGVVIGIVGGVLIYSFQREVKDLEKRKNKLIETLDIFEELKADVLVELAKTTEE